MPGGPAERDGELKIGDRIVAVAQGAGGEEIDVFNLPLAQTVELVRGPKGTDVSLIVIPAGESEDTRKRITIRRDEIHFEDQEAKARALDYGTVKNKADLLPSSCLVAIHDRLNAPKCCWRGAGCLVRSYGR